MSDKISPGQFRCEMRQKIFDLGWTEEEAQAEAEEKGLDIDNCGMVCDDCYSLTPWGGADI